MNCVSGPVLNAKMSIFPISPCVEAQCADCCLCFFLKPERIYRSRGTKGYFIEEVFMDRPRKQNVSNGPRKTKGS